MRRRSQDVNMLEPVRWTGLIGVSRATVARVMRRVTAVLCRWRPNAVREPPGCASVVCIGRDRLMARILSTIHNNSILLTGQEGIGKTSILLEIERRLRAIEDPTYTFFPVYMDLESIPEDMLFATASDAVLREAARLHPGSVPMPRGDRGADYAHRDLANDLRSVVCALSAASPRMVRLVLLVDNIDEVEGYHPRTTQRLRGLFMSSVAEHLVMVASATRISRRWEREGSPWYNFFEEIELEGLCREEVDLLVTSLTKGQAGIGEGVVERIATTTGGNPALIRARCRTLLGRLHGQNRRTLTAADVDALETPGGTRSGDTRP